MALTSDLHWSISLYATLLSLAHAAKSTGKIRPDRSIVDVNPYLESKDLPLLHSKANGQVLTKDQGTMPRAVPIDSGAAFYPNTGSRRPCA